MLSDRAVLLQLVAKPHRFVLHLAHRMMHGVGTALGWALKAVAIALMIATPSLGVWGASSLAAFLGGPVWLASGAGLLLFPITPLCWEAWAAHKRKQGKRILTLFDRLILRTG